ncbi:hypothetical protein HDU82_006374 [Entophlyctis luteolus]|nr:hypothetical protein HDU82_006374 [Entophlyctis luteolus]
MQGSRSPSVPFRDDPNTGSVLYHPQSVAERGLLSGGTAAASQDSPSNSGEAQWSNRQKRRRSEEFRVDISERSALPFDNSIQSLINEDPELIEISSIIQCKFPRQDPPNEILERGEKSTNASNTARDSHESAPKGLKVENPTPKGRCENDPADIRHMDAIRNESWSSNPKHPRNGESYFGFVDDEVDALILVESMLQRRINAFSGSAVDMARLQIRSGSVFVVPESSRYAKRWKFAGGLTLQQRQIENVKDSVVAKAEPGDAAPRIPGVDPAFSESVLKMGTQIVNDGLTKRSISVNGSDGLRHRVISYYTVEDVLNMSEQLAVSRGISTECRFIRPSQDSALKSVAKEAYFISLLKAFKGTIANSRTTQQEHFANRFMGEDEILDSIIKRKAKKFLEPVS